MTADEPELLELLLLLLQRAAQGEPFGVLLVPVVDVDVVLRRFDKVDVVEAQRELQLVLLIEEVDDFAGRWGWRIGRLLLLLLFNGLFVSRLVLGGSGQVVVEDEVVPGKFLRDGELLVTGWGGGGFRLLLLRFQLLNLLILVA